MKIWNEFYRPKKLADMILPEGHRKAFQQYVVTGLPNVIFYGAPGVGKTTAALIFIQEMGAEYLRLNGSDARGIDIIREQIKNFIQTKSFNTKQKIVFLDESEALTGDAFRALKEITERYHKSASFIFATNHLHKFPEAIRSRCTLFEFKKPTKEETIKLLTDVLDKEKVKYELETLDNVYRNCGGDLRKSLNYLQRYSMSGKLELPKETFLEIAKIIKTGDIKTMKRYFAGNTVDFDGLYRFLFEHIEDPTKIILLAKYSYQDALVVDKEINFLGFFCELAKINNK